MSPTSDLSFLLSCLHAIFIFNCSASRLPRDCPPRGPLFGALLFPLWAFMSCKCGPGDVKRWEGKRRRKKAKAALPQSRDLILSPELVTGSICIVPSHGAGNTSRKLDLSPPNVHWTTRDVQLQRNDAIHSDLTSAVDEPDETDLADAPGVGTRTHGGRRRGRAGGDASHPADCRSGASGPSRCREWVAYELVVEKAATRMSA